MSDKPRPLAGASQSSEEAPPLPEGQRVEGPLLLGEPCLPRSRSFGQFYSLILIVHFSVEVWYTCRSICTVDDVPFWQRYGSLVVFLVGEALMAVALPRGYQDARQLNLG